MQNELKATLHFHDPAHDNGIGHAESGPVPSEPWITKELLLHTQRVWSEVSGRVISAEEAVEMLQNVKGLADVLWDIMDKRVSS